LGEGFDAADVYDLGNSDGDTDVNREREGSGIDLFLEICRYLQQSVRIGHERDRERKAVSYFYVIDQG